MTTVIDDRFDIPAEAYQCHPSGAVAEARAFDCERLTRGDAAIDAADEWTLAAVDFRPLGIALAVASREPVRRVLQDIPAIPSPAR